MTEENDITIKEEEKRKEEINKLFKDFKTENEKRQVSSSENFDKSILTYSSWGLGISIAFLKDFVPITTANNPCYLYWSWYLFCAAIILTTISFLISYMGLELALVHARKYYLEENDDYFNKKNIYNIIVKISNFFCAILFILALVFTIIFVSSNLEKSAFEKEKEKMTNDSKKPVVTQGIAMDSLPVNFMQKRPAAKVPVVRSSTVESAKAQTQTQAQAQAQPISTDKNKK